MDEMNNKNQLDWYATSNAPQQTENESTPIASASAASEIKNNSNSFAYNDDPNRNNSFYSYQPNINGTQTVYVGSTMSAADNSAAQAIAKKSMIMGIIAVVTASTVIGIPAAIILGIMAIFKAVKAKKTSITGSMPGMAIPGLICGIYGLATCALMILYLGIYILVLLIELGIIAGSGGGEVYLALSSLM